MIAMLMLAQVTRKAKADEEDLKKSGILRILSPILSPKFRGGRCSGSIRLPNSAPMKSVCYSKFRSVTLLSLDTRFLLSH
jgi:hypothetical protein